MHIARDRRGFFSYAFFMRAIVRTARRTAVLGVVVAAGASVARADYPDRQVRIVVPYSAGGTSDYAARQIAQQFTKRTGQAFVAENKTGAGGRIGAMEVVRAPADGYTLLASDTSYAMLPGLFSKLQWNLESDLIPITTTLYAPTILLVSNKSPFHTMHELIAYGRAHPDKLTFGSGGVGSSTHLSTAVFDAQAKMQARHIPYKGAADALVAVLSGNVDFATLTAPSVLTQIQGHQVRALAISSAKRLPTLPNLPTFAELGMPDYRVNSWFGLLAPKGTPPAVIAKLQRLVVESEKDPAFQKMFAEMGATVGGISTSDYKTLIHDEIRNWTTAAQEAGLKPE
jgi:tripartite-type tricarboxylate transporter receptor subunit TctC